MFEVRRLSIILTILSCFLQAQGADKYTDENRPYEFGFKIDGEQHRHEKKDENGIIMGEFGFITADGVYHVTVYATDENGNFKILSMKNIRVKPYPTASARQGQSLPFPPSGQTPITQGPISQQPVSIEPPAKSCSSCSIPTTKAPQLTNLAVVSKDNPAYNNPQKEIANYPQNPQYPQNTEYSKNSQYPQNNQNSPSSQFLQNPQYPQNSQNSQIPQSPQNVQYPQNPQNSQNLQNPQNPQNPQHNYPSQDPNQSGQDYSQQGATALQYPGQNLQSGERNPKQYNAPPQGSAPMNPTLISAQMQVVDKNTDIYHRGPGEKEGLPNGLDKKDMEVLLYTFNYTVGFHGHYEEGYKSGAKKGYYFVTGRNGVRTRVDYEADENGFRPKITQEVLDILSEDVPKAETEKDDKYGLKGYEFKWLYYPADSKRR